ncbi:MAG: Flp pilus assembly protein CpaB [Candidatus Dormiibacterota bacterium]
MTRAIYLGVFLVLSLAAGAIYYASTRDVAVIVANGDLQVGSTISSGAVTVRRVHPAAIPAGSALRLDEVNGKYVAWPILDGQYIPIKALSADRASLISGGLQVPAGFRALSVPVGAADAAGGVLRAGDYVDVLAVAKNQAPGATPAPATTLGRRVLVLGLRTDQGQALDAGSGSGGVRGLNFSSNRVASVILAVAEGDEARYASAAAASTFTVVLDLG